jgi:hypothetical protein
MSTRVALIALALVAFACRKGQDATPADPKPSSESAPSGPSAQGASGALRGLLTEQDFEEEALRQINGDNIETELGLIEEEVRKK